MIAGLGMSGQVQSLYPQYNTAKVAPIKKVNTKDSSLVEELPESKQKESSVSVSDELKNATQVSYSTNPYDQARKIAENTLLSGQNIDIAV